MTVNQWRALQIGDLVTRTSGPNCGVVMKVTDKYLAYEPAGEVLNNICISAEGVEPNSVYNQMVHMRGKNHTNGGASGFKVLTKRKTHSKWAVCDGSGEALYFVDHKPSAQEILDKMEIYVEKV